MTDEAHGEHLAHHFDSMAQQFEAAKLGMWLFLATEVLLFGGLFCAYAILRGNHPAMFEYGSRFLNVSYGAVNTVILIVSSLTMALAVSAAQRGHTNALCTLLALTILGGAGFMSIKYVEYSHKFHEHLVWGVGFYQPPSHDPLAAHPAGASMAEHAAVETETFVADLERGRDLWMGTCKQCHGVRGEGVPGQGLDQRGSKFIAGLDDRQLLAFVKIGRTPFDPLNQTGIQMPPKGGNLLLMDEDLLNIIAYIRTFEAAPKGGDDDDSLMMDIGPVEITRSVVPPAARGPGGLDRSILARREQVEVKEAEHAAPISPQLDPERPRDLHLFFGIYFLMTGLHGVHVMIGMVVIGWLLIRARSGCFGPDYFIPVDLVGLYWHVVDLIWIFLFPLFYLIG